MTGLTTLITGSDRASELELYRVMSRIRQSGIRRISAESTSWPVAYLARPSRSLASSLARTMSVTCSLGRSSCAGSCGRAP